MRQQKTDSGTQPEDRLPLLSVGSLRCEYLTNPVAIDSPLPRLSWRLESGYRGQRQVAYIILVASSRESLDKNIGDTWDSGKVPSDQSLNILYDGSVLESRSEYFWKVRVWDSYDGVSQWSEVARFGTGVFPGQSWQGEWIRSHLELFEWQREMKKLPTILRKGDHYCPEQDWIQEQAEAIDESPAVWFRKVFSVDAGLRRATVLISGLGFYEIHLNGHKADNQYFNIAPADYTKTLPYLAHDVTGQLQDGVNTIGVILGNGHFNPVVPFRHREYAYDFIETPRLRCEVVLEYTNGRREVVRTDTTWKYTTDGPIRFNAMRSGETYDARRDLGEWTRTEYDDQLWKPAILTEGPLGTPSIQLIPPVRVLSEVPSVSLEPIDGGWRFDLGVQLAGWARLTLHGKRGQRIIIKYPGATNHTLGPYQTCQYICRGEGEEVFEPHFSYNGYQHVEVFGLDYKPRLEDCVGLLVASDLKKRGEFSCSDPRLNKLQEIHLRTIRNYYVQVPADPVREKAMWTQDMQGHFEPVGYNFDITLLYDKWQQDLLDHCQPDGFVPAIVPSCFAGDGYNGPWWGGMIVYNPWQLYRFYGELKILATSYPYMQRYMGYLDSIATKYIVDWGLGDWQDAKAQKEGYGPPKSTSVAFTSTCAYFYYTDILRQTALELGLHQDALVYQKQREAIRKAIEATFLDPSTGAYDTGSQTALIFALRLGIAKEESHERILHLLEQRVIADDYHLTSGFVGLPYLLTELSERGLGNLAWRIATQESYPSWIDMVFNRKNTAFMEAWDGGFVQMPSLAASIGAWFFRSLGGIRPEAPGFKTFIVQPYTETLDAVTCSYESEYGPIRSEWKKSEDSLILNIQVPVNTSATVYMPAGQIFESGVPVANSDGVSFLRNEKGNQLFRVESGTYSFRSPIDSGAGPKG